MRAPTDREFDILRRLTSVEFEGVEAIREQIGAIRGVEPNCACGCPSVTPHLDRTLASPHHGRSPLPVELAELHRPDGIARTVLCFLDDDGYIVNLECVYYDDPIAQWPDPDHCAVLLKGERSGWQAVALPNGRLVRPQQANDMWVSFEAAPDGGFCASTHRRLRECYAADGTLTTRDFTT
jgi:hypothetical protein